MLKSIDMKKPLIGVTAGEIYNRERPWGPKIYGQSFTYTDSIVKAGGLPVIIPLTDDMSIIDEFCGRIDGLMMSGGNDIDPKMYGEKPRVKLDELSDLRDNMEKRMLDNALENKTPILGICRGLQMINIYFGGTLYQDIKTDLPDALNHEASTESKNLEDKAHTLQIEKTSKLFEILGTESLESNTHHHQAVKKLGKGLKVTARTEDGIVEGLETDDDRFIIAVQSHPESLGSVIPTWGNLFEAFTQKARANQTS
jgi:putative glutamine amidotransferase